MANAVRVPELRRRVLFTAMILAVYRTRRLRTLKRSCYVAGAAFTMTPREAKVASSRSRPAASYRKKRRWLTRD
jgi:hypothetical protein